MGKETRFEPTGLGPFQNMFQTYYGGLDTAAQSFEPLFKGMARWQLEALGLVARRAQAYMEIPSRLSQCRTPQDILQEQSRFWQTAFAQYSESSHRMMAAWAQMAAAPMSSVARAVDGKGKTKRERDYITFPEPKPVSAPAAARVTRERRVA